MARLILNLDLLAKGRMADLRRICGVDEEDLADMVRELRAYDPKPGCRFVSAEPEAITPDVLVRRTGSGLDGRAQQRGAAQGAGQPPLSCRVEARAAGQVASKAWLGECLASANWLVKALDQRARTIVKVASEIVKQQQGFFEQGVSALRPLTLAKVAEAIEMHESTVSRVTSNKYLACDRGMFELIFLRLGRRQRSGEGAAAEAVKAAIKATDRWRNRNFERRYARAMLKDRASTSPAARWSNIARRWGSDRRSSAAASGKWSAAKATRAQIGDDRSPCALRAGVDPGRLDRQALVDDDPVERGDGRREWKLGPVGATR